MRFFSDWERARLFRWVSEGRARRDMAEQLGRTQGSINQFFVRNGLAVGPRPTVWSEEEGEIAEKMFKAGSTYTAIGKVLNKSRSAVGGFLHRRGVARNEPGKSWRAPRPKALKAACAPLPEPDPASIEVLNLEDPGDGCKYPTGDNPYKFCGHERTIITYRLHGKPHQRKSSYCKYHHRLCHIPKSRKAF